MNHRQIFLENQAQTSDFPLAIEMEYAKGMYQFDVNGQGYLDLISGIGVSSLGHCHPNVVTAIQKQAETYQHLMVYGEFIQHPQTRLASLLKSLLPENLQCFYFVNSGAEATETAMKLAKKYTKRSHFLAFNNAYHGSTQGALSLMGSNEFPEGYGPLLPNISHFPYNSLECLDSITQETAAVFVEVVQAESGVNPANPEFLKAIRSKCTEVGALLVFDEIQTGIGRTGKFFGFEHFKIVPDILLLAKGLGGGMPIGACISSSTIFDVIRRNPVLGHITTYGGNAVCCASACAVIETLQNSTFIEEVKEKSELFISLLQSPHILSIRNLGLIMALEFSSFEQNKAIIDGCLKDGLITDWFLFAPNCLRIAPPLIITRAEIEIACSILLQNIQKYA